MSTQESPVTGKNEVDKIMEYIMNTPENTNPAILRGMLKNLGSGGGGDSDFSTAEVTLSIQQAQLGARCHVAIAADEDENSFSNTIIFLPGTYNIIMYKQKALLTIDSLTGAELDISVTGDADVIDGDVIITGDCTVSITAAPENT